MITADLTDLTIASLLRQGTQTAETEATELLAENGYPDAMVVLVRSAGDTLSGFEEIWFRDQYGRKLSATLVPQERKPMNGHEVRWTHIEFEYGW